MRLSITGFIAAAALCLPQAADALNLYAYNDAQLAVAISQAGDGDTIKIGPGNYGKVLIANGIYNQVNVGGFLLTGAAPTLSANVTIESLNPNNRAIISSVDIRSNYWSFNNLTFAPAPAGKYFDALHFRGNNNQMTNSVVTYGDSTNWGISDWLSNAGRGIVVDGMDNYVYNNYFKNVSTGLVVEYNSNNNQIIHNTVENLIGDAVQAHGNNTLIEKNLFKNFKMVDGNHDDCVQSFASQGGVIGAGQVSGMTIRGNMCISNVDLNDPLYSGTQGYTMFNGVAADWVVENNILVSSTYHGIRLANAENAVISHNTILDDTALFNGANTDWIWAEGISPGNVVKDNIANEIKNGSNVTFSNNETINISEYDDWFVDWRNYDFRLKPTAPNPTVGAVPMNPGALFDPFSPPTTVPLPGSLAMMLGGLGLAGGLCTVRRRSAVAARG